MPVLLFLPVLVLGLWGAGALAFHGRYPAAMAAAWGLLCLATLVGLWLYGLRGAVPLVLAGAGLMLWWSTILPRADRDWEPRLARAATIEVDGDRYTVRNLRNFRWAPEPAADGSERAEVEAWEDRTYDLSKVNGLDLFFSYWTGPAIAHVLVSATFEDQPPLVFSIEIRRERGEAYSAIAGFFKNYELAIVAADERDIVRLRSHVWREDVKLYRLKVAPESIRALLLAYAREVNDVAAEPRWYDTLGANCTTVAYRLARAVWPDLAFDWRVVASGYAPRFAYEIGALEQGLPFAELERRAALTERATPLPNDENFSTALRRLVESP